jgi:hypothetical protein
LEFQHENTGALGHYAVRQLSGFNGTMVTFASQSNIQWYHGARVKLYYTDAEGHQYHSCLDINDHEHFEILSVENGDPTWFGGSANHKVTFQIRGWLVNVQDQNDQVYIEQLEGTLGFKIQ